MLGKQCKFSFVNEDLFFIRVITALIFFCLSGCAAYGGLYKLSIGNDEIDDPTSSTTLSVDHKSVYLLPAVIGQGCSAVCVQKADDGIGCVRYSEKAAAECEKYTGEKK